METNGIFSRRGELCSYLPDGFDSRTNDDQSFHKKDSSDALRSILSTANESIAAYENRLRMLWDNTSDAVRITDANGSIVDVNRAYCSMTGMSCEDLKGMPYYIVYCDTELEKTLRSSTGKLLTGKLACITEKNLKVSFINGGNYSLEGKYVLTGSANEKFIMTIFRDVTAGKIAEENLRKTSRLAEIGAMAVYFAHEIKSPVAAMKSHLEQLIGRKSIRGSAKNSINVCYQEASRLERLLKDVLHFTRSVPMARVKVNLKKMLTNTVNVLSPEAAGKNISINILLSDHIHVTGDSQKLQTVFFQMLENSVDAVEQKGIIGVCAEESEDGKFIVVTIEDNGKGIEYPEKIFEPFYTTKQTGTGLGLPIALKIAEEHGGSIRLLSAKPGETIFEVRLKKELEDGESADN